MIVNVLLLFFYRTFEVLEELAIQDECDPLDLVSNSSNVNIHIFRRRE